MKSLLNRLNALETVEAKRSAVRLRASKAERDEMVKSAIEQGTLDIALEMASKAGPNGSTVEQRVAAVRAAFSNHLGR